MTALPSICEIDYRTRTIHYQGKAIAAPPLELKILEALIAHRGSVVTTTQLLTYVKTEAWPKIIDVAVCRLRRKLEVLSHEASAAVVTIWGRGYTLAEAGRAPIPVHPILPTDGTVLARTRWTRLLKLEILAALECGKLDQATLMADNYITEVELAEWTKALR